MTTTSILLFQKKNIYSFLYDDLKSLKNLEGISCPNHSVGRCCAGRTFSLSVSSVKYVGVEFECHRQCPSQTVLALEFF